MKGYKAILEALAAKALNVPAGELAELFKKTDEELTDEDITALSDKLNTQYRNVVTQINTTNNKKLDDKFKEGQRRAAEQFEKSLKETFAVDSDKTGQELIDDIRESLQQQDSSKGKKGELTDDDVKKHPVYLKAEAEFKKQLKAEKEAAEKSINELKATQSQKELFDEVSKEALQKFESWNPVLSDDPKKAANQKGIVVDLLRKYDWQKTDDGKYIALYKDGENKGKRVENELGVAPEFDHLLKESASEIFDFKVAEDRSAPNGDKGKAGTNNGGSGSSSSTYKGPLPKTEEEYNRMMNDDKIPLKDRMAINDHWAVKASA